MSKKDGKSKKHLKVRNLLFSKKAIRRLKLVGGITIGPPLKIMGGTQLRLGRICGAGVISTKAGWRAEIGIFGFLRNWTSGGGDSGRHTGCQPRGLVGKS